MSKEAMKLALELFEQFGRDSRLKYEHQAIYKTIVALKEALAKQEQGEPVGQVIERNGEFSAELFPLAELRHMDRLYANQHQNECTRSHPHEEMSKECELRTETARLTNKLANIKQEQGEPQPALYVKDIDGNFHLHKEKGHTENCAAFGDDCSENHLSPSRLGVGKNNSTTKQEQGDPVGEMQLSAIYEGMVVPVVSVELPVGAKLYTTPQQRKPLTDEQILNVARDHYNPNQRAEISFARAIEAAHGIKE